MTTPIPDTDLVVEYCEHEAVVDLKWWCVSRRGALLFTDPAVDPVIAFALAMTAAEGCAAWLIVNGRSILITSRSDARR